MKKVIIGSALILTVVVVLGLVASLHPGQSTVSDAAVVASISTQSPATPTQSLAAATLYAPATAAAPASTQTGTPTTGPTATPTRVNLTPLPPTVSGVVVNADGPVEDAIVQIYGSPKQIKTTKTGAFSFSGISGTKPITITAWYAGFYIGWVQVNPSDPKWTGGQNLKITLKPYPTTDNNTYTWFTFNGVTGSASCGLCHREYKEWLADAHSQSAKNIRFLTMYTGEDVNGNPGQLTEFTTQGKVKDPDTSKGYYGPGYLLDNPTRAGNCATCHTPMASTAPTDQNCGWSGCHNSLTIENSHGIIAQAASPLSLQGPAADGISCDFCHKISAVTIDPVTKLPPADMPGILSMKMTRPVKGQEIFYGTLVDIPRRASYLPLLDQSEYCAPCHYGVFGGVMGVGTVTNGTLVYNSYGEWLDSPYSNAETGKTCQDCHMPKSSSNWFVFSDKGGIERDYATLHNHAMPGATDKELLQNSVTMKSTASRQGDQILTEVSITNDKTGHDVPTDEPLRSMILVIEAVDQNGKTVTLAEGPVNPDYSGNYAGLPGKTYAKILKDDWTGEAPTGAYWRDTSIASDNRIKPFETDTTRYTFNAPAGEKVTLKVSLLYRRAFQKLAQEKGWTDPDILMEEATITVAANQ